MKGFCWDKFDALPLIGILRGFDRRLLPGIIHASIAGGLSSIEVTMNSPDAAGQIDEATQLAAGRLNVGAGTVLNLALLETAIAAGASFIVTPGFDKGVVRRCVQDNIPVFPGAFTPSEILRAADWGATWVKIFPADALGEGSLRQIKTSFATIKLLATGGVSLETLPAFLQAGADGFGIGSPLFAPDRIQAEAWDWLENRCRAFVEAHAQTRSLLTSAPLTHTIADRFDQGAGSPNGR